MSADARRPAQGDSELTSWDLGADLADLHIAAPRVGVWYPMSTFFPGAAPLGRSPRRTRDDIVA